MSAISPVLAQTPILKVRPDEQPVSVSAEDKLSEMFSKIMETPDDMDNNFAYAQLATQMGKYDEAIAAYERILIAHPKAARVKMEMAVVYSRMGNMVEAQKLAKEVLQGEVPPKVKENVNKFLANVEKNMKRHSFGGSITLGFNSDSNANSAPMSGLVETADLGIGSLTENSRRASDDHRFLSAGINHKYLMATDKPHVWNSSINFYKTNQSSMENLNLTAKTLTTGPQFIFPQSRTNAGFNISYGDVHLDEQKYLRNSSLETYGEYILHPKMKLKGSWKREHRRFQNSPTSTTTNLRSGRTNQQTIIATVAATPKDIINITTAFRQESTKTKYNNNRQLSINIGYTHVFPKDYFMNMSVGSKTVKYQGLDVAISTSKIRQDNERTMSLMVGKKINDHFTANVAYQYRDVRSNIMNYEYENERVTAAITYQY